MCGIAGWVSHQDSGQEMFHQYLSDALKHRGPDGEGFYDSPPIHLVHRRLAIIDPTGGKQPLYSPQGHVLVLNGEIYNDKELRSSMPDAVYQTGSDAESVLHLYERYGLEAIQKLRGMYAFALFDVHKKELILSRDPFGIKPLYYYQDHLYFAFASEPQALAALPFVTRALNPQKRDELLRLRYTTGRETPFQNIFRVLPGETLVVRDQHIVGRYHQDALSMGPAPTMTYNEAIGALDQTLEDSVDLHLRSDVPYGLFLSGGIDSAAMAVLMKRRVGPGFRTFTTTFPDHPSYDEGAAARVIAETLGSYHKEIPFYDEDFWALLPDVVTALDDPTLDHAAFPTYKMAKVASDDVKVVLCGEGGDELLAGYKRYNKALRPRWFGRRLSRRRHVFSGIDVLKSNDAGWDQYFTDTIASASMQGRTPLQQAQEVDIHHWLSGDLLTKLDRTLMASGVEGRTPFLDLPVASLLFGLPDHFKIGGGVRKRILRDWLAGELPGVDTRSKKKGFTLPVEQWIRTKGAVLGPKIAALPWIEEMAHPEKVRALFTSPNKRDGYGAWALLFYALWYKKHIRCEAITGPIEDVF